MEKLHGVSSGSVENFTWRVIKALNNLAGQEVRWPTREERDAQQRMLAPEGFPGCIGFVDGTTINLSQKPAIDGETYFDRKKRLVTTV